MVSDLLAEQCIYHEGDIDDSVAYDNDVGDHNYHTYAHSPHLAAPVLDSSQLEMSSSSYPVTSREILLSVLSTVEAKNPL